MKFDEQRVGDAVVLTPEADMDLREVPSFSTRVEALVAGGARRLVVDLGRVTILLSPAVGVLVLAVSRLRRVGGHVILARPSRRVRGTLTTMGLEGLLPVFEDVESALRET